MTVSAHHRSSEARRAGAQPPTPPPPEPTAPQPATARRRRLWQLPAQAHDLLLATSFTPESLRHDATKALARLHRRPCLLQGRDVDVLYSVVHDLGTRNGLSEAMQRRLDERHALAVRQLGSVHDLQALRSAWARALSDDAVAATLWALLTHPQGPVLESALLYDARDWVFAHCRRSLALGQSRQQALDRARHERERADALQARLMVHQREAADALGDAQREAARLRGELERLRSTASRPCAPAPVPDRLPSRERPVAAPSLAARVSAPSTTAPDRQCSPPALAAPVPTPVQVQVHGRRVLCVGGIRHAVMRYRGRIEALGGRFEHHDGGLEDGVNALDARLSRADLVICQAACINHDAYHRIKRHCERTGTPCVYLDRPSLSRLDRALVGAQDRPHAAG